ncbi:zinc finger protein 511 isoform X2 [Parus major]|uniref:zinc finger protein 511 isoform X2 n=1 Tax=Parus major TaxID=9157 RepID=UPI0008F4A6DC|nr:zinc finger protein 511 isoform X2 [Parus major]
MRSPRAMLPLPPRLHLLLREGLPPLPQDLPSPHPPQPTPPFTFAPRRLRLGPQHPLFEDGDVHRHLYLQGVLTSLEEVAERPKVSEFSCHISGCSQVFDTLEGYEHHYNTLHRNVCSFCKRSFPSGNLLDIHILEWHDSLFQIMAEKQNMYQCLVEGCTEKFKSSKDRKDHLVTVHLYPADFRFDRPKKVKSGSKHTNSPMEQGDSVPMDVSVDMAEQFQVNPVETGPEENMEISQPAASSGPSLPEKRLYKSRSVLWPLGQMGLGPLHLISPLQHWGVLHPEDERGRNPMCASKAIFERRKCEEEQNVGVLWKLCLSAHLISSQGIAGCCFCSPAPHYQPAATAQVLHLLTHLFVKRPPGQECAGYTGNPTSISPIL